jgi:hypothetical protein
LKGENRRKEFPEFIVMRDAFIGLHQIPAIQLQGVFDIFYRGVAWNGDRCASCTAIGVGLRNRKEKLPAFKLGAGTASCEALQIYGFYDGKTRVGLYMDSLCPQLGVHIIVNAPQPFGQIFLVTFYGVFRHVFGKAFATILARKNIGKGVEELAHLGSDAGSRARESYKM